MDSGRPVTVRCYAGYMGEQEPRAIELDGGPVAVDIERRWREPGADYFVVRAAGGDRLRLRRDRDTGAWTVAG